MPRRRVQLRKKKSDNEDLKANIGRFPKNDEDYYVRHANREIAKYTEIIRKKRLGL